MKTYVGVDVQIHIFLASALVEVEWSVSLPGRFTPRQKSPLYLLDRRLAGPQGRYGRRGEENILPLQGFELRPLGRPACS
jgi:hypothetical protein